MTSRGAFRLFSMFIALMFALPPARADEPLRTLQSFGVAVQHGQPVYPLPANVALGLFNPDPLPDLLYHVENTVQLWQNNGDGTFGIRPVFERRAQGTILKMEIRKSKMMGDNIQNPASWGEIVLAYANGSEEVISHTRILQSRTPFASLPQHSNGPQLCFREVWKSEPNAGLCDQVSIGDIDNDGRLEMAYWFYSPPGQPDVNRLAIYEVVGNDSIRLDWDTLFYGAAGGPFGLSDIDKNGRKEILIFRNGCAFVECFGPGQYRYYSTNLYPPITGATFRMMETDIDHDGTKEITMLTSDLNAVGEQTIFSIGRYSGKGQASDGTWSISFSTVQLARFPWYSFDMAIGQIDGTGRDEIVPAGGSFGVNQPVPINYLWYSGIPGLQLWQRRQIHTGLKSGTGAVMFANLDSDTVKEFISGAPGPIGHGSMFALKYISDTTWTVLWADSSLRNAPLWVNAGMLSGTPVVAGANTFSPNFDTIWSKLNTYAANGASNGVWLRDSGSIQQFHFVDINHNEKTNLVFAQLSHQLNHRLAVFEAEEPTRVPNAEHSPASISLHQNYPNPFNPTTTIRFEIPLAGLVSIAVFDIVGREVKTLINDNLQAGVHKVTWNGTNSKGGDVSSGVYLYRLVVSDRNGNVHSAIKRMVLIK
ncbi:MAG: T9SS type A sorting domain-containing protein [Bacteroidetes bacterium]|nr:T9SS type A sorting domain-containing protein [Bacteroidota bacterium]MCW5895661.1 T9SS type A sorting domain-containing protein [Bacteroidota bacterium]